MCACEVTLEKQDSGILGNSIAEKKASAPSMWSCGKSIGDKSRSERSVRVKAAVRAEVTAWLEGLMCK